VRFARDVTHLTRSVARTILDQVSITTSGLFTQPPLEVAVAVFGIERVLFSIDYPYSSNQQGRDFLDALKVPAADIEKVAHGNADRLLMLK
jgi:predicted TIM-barrel fold metal-dependent hydrolase